MSRSSHEIESFAEEILWTIHWVSMVTLIAGLVAVVGSFEKTIDFMLQELIIPSILVNVSTLIIMEILKTRFPSIYRLIRRILSL